MVPKKEINPDNQRLRKSGYRFKGDKSIANLLTLLDTGADYLKVSFSDGKSPLATSRANSLAPLKSSVLKFR